MPIRKIVQSKQCFCFQNQQTYFWNTFNLWLFILYSINKQYSGWRIGWVGKNTITESNMYINTLTFMCKPEFLISRTLQIPVFQTKDGNNSRLNQRRQQLQTATLKPFIHKMCWSYKIIHLYASNKRSSRSYKWYFGKKGFNAQSIPNIFNWTSKTKSQITFSDL